MKRRLLQLLGGDRLVEHKRHVEIARRVPARRPPPRRPGLAAEHDVEVERDVILDVTAKRARVGADVRTSATHAQWREFAEGDVQETIRITRELIEQHLAS